MRDDKGETPSCAKPATPSHPSADIARIAELEVENVALRWALARAGFVAGRTGLRHDSELADERTGRAIDRVGPRTAAIEAEARHGREIAVARADLAAAESNTALWRANAALAESEGTLREGEAQWRGLFESMHEGFAVGELVHDADEQAVAFAPRREPRLGAAHRHRAGGDVQAPCG